MRGWFRRQGYGDPNAVWWRRHSLSLVLCLVIFIELAWTAVGGWFATAADAKAHGQTMTVSAYLLEVWGYQIPLSMVAEPHGLLLMVLLSKWFFEEGSAESGGNGEQRQKEKESA